MLECRWGSYLFEDSAKVEAKCKTLAEIFGQISSFLDEQLYHGSCFYVVLVSSFIAVTSTLEKNFINEELTSSSDIGGDSPHICVSLR